MLDDKIALDCHLVKKLEQLLINEAVMNTFINQLRDNFECFKPYGKWYVIYDKYCMEYSPVNQFLLDEALSYYMATNGIKNSIKT